MAKKQAISIPVAQTSEAPPPSFVEIGIESVIGERRVTSVAGQVGDPIDLQVGQMHTHRAVSNVPILGVRWTVFGSTLKGYPMSVQAGAPVPLDAQDLTTNPITFAWIEPGFFLVGAEITTPYGKHYVSHSFNVFAPQVLGYAAQVGQTAVYDEHDRTFLGLRSGPDHMGPGIQFTASVQAGPGVSGQLGFIQLAYDERAFVDFHGKSWLNRINSEWVLDNGANPHMFLYAGRSWALAPGQTAAIATNDSPAMELGPPIQIMNIGVTPLPVEQYLMLVCFLPAGPGNIWVPLAQIAWYWGGTSKFDDHTQEYGPATHTSGGAYQSEPPRALPRWTKNVGQGGYDPTLAASLAAHATRASAAASPPPELAAAALA